MSSRQEERRGPLPGILEGFASRSRTAENRRTQTPVAGLGAFPVFLGLSLVLLRAGSQLDSLALSGVSSGCNASATHRDPSLAADSRYRIDVSFRCFPDVDRSVRSWTF